MPNYNAHIEIAEKAAGRHSHPVLESNMGSFLMGSTAPDIRVITRGTREQYHFAPLEFKSLGDGVEGLFRAQPQLAAASSLQEPTQAFIAGYLTHIIADELWILTMYRPFFGNRKVFSNPALGNLMDRAVQLDLDRQAREHLNEMREVRSLIEGAGNSIDVGFIPRETISQWRNWLLGALDRRFAWERLRFMARRISSSTDEAEMLKICEEFIESVPLGMERIYQHVPEEEVSAYKEDAIRKSMRVVEDYLP